MKYNELTEEEAQVILYKETEPPFTGKYTFHWEEGIYTCKRCGAQLYRSSDKFDAGCGWPSFDDEIPGAVKKTPDRDGVRTEIVCANCGAHLGHIFFGEGFTEKNVRHCVNSISLNFIPATQKDSFEIAIFAAGCFWSVEYYFKKITGVISTRVGYTGGHKENPTYEEVCKGDTGHAEAVEIVFDPKVVSYEQLVKIFFEMHDPTQYNRQGPDVGEQYRSEIFYLNDEQKKIAEKIIRLLKNKGYKITTKITKALFFWPAEEYHQNYYNKRGWAPRCDNSIKKFLV